MKADTKKKKLRSIMKMRKYIKLYPDWLLQSGSFQMVGDWLKVIILYPL